MRRGKEYIVGMNSERVRVYRIGVRVRKSKARGVEQLRNECKEGRKV